MSTGMCPTWRHVADLLAEWTRREITNKEMKKKHHRVETSLMVVESNEQAQDFLLNNAYKTD